MTKIKKTSTHFQNKKELENECAEVFASNIIGGQWALAICCYLINGKHRFGELKKCLPNITERMLSLQLRKLEENKLVKRTVYAEVPPRVEYELTSIGHELKPLIKELENWGVRYKKHIRK
ncbi:DNA-binding transcriptional regulator, HxlR family [Algoriphagus locisalis]|uniref:DNA-binding transcriptional regulator, HxlR family n=1 Tax=Algoriphagus locisalis TaxID=305507 RepID=A0A1I7E4M5_9BACT|nr:winged helix-turn-helix transcriptional regulator [Algoriphagus locisalis]SFU18773.1 DNA-binding transcriptional regulator, HxlR family [Algoriphagus locisalis]